MKRSAPMKRTGQIKPKRKQPRQANPLKAGSTGRALCPKGPWKSREHLDRVKAQHCLAWNSGGGWGYATRCDGPMDPHHCRKLLPAGLLPRDDRFAVPLCRKHHKAMDGNERATWKAWGIDPATWISNFSEEGRRAIADLQVRDA